MAAMRVNTIQKYLEDNRISQVKFSGDLGIHPVYLNSIIKGRRKASPLLARRMEDMSRGKIPAKSLRPDIF